MAGGYKAYYFDVVTRKKLYGGIDDPLWTSLSPQAESEEVDVTVVVFMKLILSNLFRVGLRNPTRCHELLTRLKAWDTP